MLQENNNILALLCLSIYLIAKSIINLSTSIYQPITLCTYEVFPLPVGPNIALRPGNIRPFTLLRIRLLGSFLQHFL